MSGIPDLKLAGRRVLLTGGSRGIGAATVRLLTLHGARVAFTYRERVDAAAGLFSGLNGDCAAGMKNSRSSPSSSITACATSK